MKRIGLFLLAAVMVIGLVECSKSPTDPSGGGNEFSSGGQTLIANVSSTANTKTVTVTESNGTIVLTMAITTTGATTSAPGQSGTTMTFRQPLEVLPSDHIARTMAVFAAGGIVTSRSVGARYNYPGCDWFPDTRCTLGCCAAHDKCYSDNKCSSSSWLNMDASDACTACNGEALMCMASKCKWIWSPGTTNNCYNTTCDKKYDCPPDYDNCDCKDICTEKLTAADIAGTYKATKSSNGLTSFSLDLTKSGKFTMTDHKFGISKSGSFTVDDPNIAFVDGKYRYSGVITNKGKTITMTLGNQGAPWIEFAKS